MPDQRNQIEPFIEAVGRFIDEHELFRPGSSVVVGVSGGSDSVALLSALRELSAAGRAYRLTVAHLNHSLRDGADADAAFVADLARGWDLPCVAECRDVAGEARRRGQGIEQAGRMLRYEFFEAVARESGAKYVAVGQHADDNIETVLYRIFRGTHIRGLTGIPAVRKLGDSGIALVRPLLEMHRDEIEVYCRRGGLPWRVDPTNADVGYRRNFIRHELLPLLRSKLNTRVDEAIGRLVAAAGEVEEFVCECSAETFEQVVRSVSPDRIALDAAALSARPRVIQTCTLRVVLERLGVGMRAFGADQFARLGELLSAEMAQAVTLPGGLRAGRQGSELVVERIKGPGRVSDVRAETVTLQCPGETMLPDGRKIVCCVEPFDRAVFAEHCRGHPAGVEMLDADQISGNLTARPRRAGDGFVPLGSGGRQTVSDFLTNLKLPRCRRDDVRCICDELGIVYLAPLRIDDRVRASASTGRVVKIALT